MAAEAFKNIDYKNITVSEPTPDRVKDIDVNNKIYDNIIDAQESSNLDTSSINSFTNISRSRNEVYALLDLMGEDPIISSALEIYASDATEPNDQGRIMWAEANDENISGAVTQILDSLNVDKNAYSQIYSLIKYGDLYLKLYRKSEFSDTNVVDKKSLRESLEKIINDNPKLKEKIDVNNLNEDIILKIFSKNDRYAEYAEMIKNPAEVFDLVQFGKTCGFIKTDVPVNSNKDDIITQISNNFRYNFSTNDVEIYGATEFVHAALEDNSDRVSEEVSLTTGDNEKTYKVKRGQSILYNSFKIWRELSLLENSVMLNRLTKSSIIRTINVEVGDMGKTEVQTLLRRIKGLIEQKSAYNVNRSLQDYMSPGPMENVLYFPVHEGKGAVTAAQIGGDVNVGDLTDLDYWKNKMYGSLGIPKQFLGDTDDATGFNGGTSLALTSSRYAKSIKRIQNAFIQMYTDAVNLILLDRGQKDFINKFALKMQAPTTQEEKDRKENMLNSLNAVREVMGLLDMIEDRQTKLEILKSLLANAITNQEVIGYIQNEIDSIEANELEEAGSGSDELEDFDDFGGGSTPLGGDTDLDLPPMDEIESEPLEIPEEPAESFLTGEGELLNEKNDLPSFDELGVSFNNIK